MTPTKGRAALPEDWPELARELAEAGFVSEASLVQELIESLPLHDEEDEHHQEGRE